MKKTLLCSRALIAAILLSLGLEKASAQIDPSTQPTKAPTSQMGIPGIPCY